MVKRWERLALNLKKGEAAVLFSEINRLYMTGFAASDGAVIVTQDGAVFLTDSRYIEAAENAVSDMPCKLSRSLFEDIAGELSARAVQHAYTEQELLPLAAFHKMEKTFGVDVIGDSSLDGWIRELREVKTAEEKKCMERAQALTDAGYLYALSRIEVGMTERDLALDMEFFMRKQGSEGVAFDFIVASGPNTSLPHAVPTDRRIRKGDFLTMDFGARVGGYCSDMTRTVAVGAVSGEQEAIYELVKKAQLEGIRAVRAGVPCADADAACRDVIIAGGYGPQFGHSTGHGVGLEIHEWPSVSAKSPDTLKVGEVVTVEPGIYLPGKFGVRIEDMVMVTADGCDDFTKSEKNLTIL